MFSDPTHCIEQFDLQSGSRVADLGAGTGAFSIAAATAVGEAGKVYAIEVQKGLLERLKNEARAARAQNVEALWGDIERINGTHLKDASVDAAVASNVLFQVEDKNGFVTETKRILKSGGKMLLIDWSDSFNNMGPHKNHVVTENAARELFEKTGFQFVKKIDAGQHHYGLVFRK
jgi:ubiquinone/menaquinone biosynthesis C-methylase UbiE